MQKAGSSLSACFLSKIFFFLPNNTVFLQTSYGRAKNLCSISFIGDKNNLQTPNNWCLYSLSSELHRKAIFPIDTSPSMFMESNFFVWHTVENSQCTLVF